ncbi:MAG TPA: hemolysin family protein [Vicinamibacterales bacterium]|nr:hemolysin family protein [Vicinamibacterales bacterium]HOG29475.1 hemolysin family protein [Vicinamibacterales bacterium]HOQ59165.1 hemolysin family protein [Vicinamibacterales bacterium]HPW19815.1 hemolysin family protein [Vicinamibacterales bacterium]
MDAIGFEVLVIAVLLVANGVFAMAEIAVVAARKSRLRHWAERGDARARAALDLASSPDRFLAAVQVGISAVGILAGAFGGATIAGAIAARLQGVPRLAPYGDAIGLAVVVTVITYCSLVIGELVPKRLALNHPERLASYLAGPMRRLSAAAAPVVWLLEASTRAVLWLLRAKPSKDPVITPEELKLIISQGTEGGVFEAAEQEMLEGVLHLADRTVGALMTPRTRMVSVDVDDPPDAILRKIAASHRSRFPVVQHDEENVIGILRSKDLLVRVMAGEPFDLRPLLQPVVFVPESMTAPRVLETFKQQGAHIAIVTDEFGSVQGLVTQTDILESIVGELPARGEGDPPSAVRRDDGTWLVDGLLDIPALREAIALPELPGEHEGVYQTVGGFITHLFGRIPAAGQHATWRDWRFEVVDMDGHRVDKVLVGPLAR